MTVCAALLVAPGAQASGQTSGGGPATVILPACAQSSPFGEALVPECSYVALPKKGGGTYYAYLTSGGEIRMAGSLTSGELSLPASGQTWPGISVPGGFVSVQVQKADITGSVDAAGSVTLSVPYRVAISAGVFGSCTAKGTASMSSSATDPIGGGQGSGFDPATQGFAVSGTSSPTLTGRLCAFADDYLDLSRGLGWYLDGSLALTPSVPGSAAGAIVQTASVQLPKRIKRKGRTVLLTGPVVTSANQTADAALTWGTKRSAKGTPGRYAQATTKGGKVTIRTTGRAKKLFVRLRLRAPATQGFKAYTATRRWVVR
jgi:hypothetical protein